MGQSKLDYNSYMDHEPEWKERGIGLPKWVDDVMAEDGVEPVCAVDFYNDLFGDDLEVSRMPEDYVTGEYAAIAIEKLTDKKANRITVTQGNQELFDLIDRSENFCMVAPISYAGKNRKNENARYMYALALEIDDIKPNGGVEELFYSWNRKNVPTLKPTYVVCSGNGLHLYFLFERPIPLYKNIFERLNEIKKELVPEYWNRFTTTMKERADIQWESLNQPFRCVGSRTKEDSYVMAFKVGDKITIEYLNKFLPKDKKLGTIYKSNLSLEKAKEIYPDWYQRRIVEKQDRGHWNRHRGIYDNWKSKMYREAKEGHRYNCLENLCSLAVQCNISPEEVENDCRKLAEYLETLTKKDDNHFTEYDIICALRTYQQPAEATYRRKIEYISQKTGISLLANKRNGRKQKTHLKIARSTLDIMNDENGRPLQGRRSKKIEIQLWRMLHFDGRKIDCERDTGFSRHTILKWWDSELTREELESVVTDDMFVSDEVIENYNNETDGESDRP